LRTSGIIALFLGVFSGAFADEANWEPSALIDDYVAASTAQEGRFRGASMEVDIVAEVPKLHKTARLHALRRISAFGRRITYDALRFDGDHGLKNDVIARYLTAESEALKSEPATMAVTPVNYKFKYKGLMVRDGRKVYAFRVTPRKKKLGLFVGELWLDPETHLAVREAGRLVKNPSVFVRRIDFVRDFRIENGVSIPTRVESSVDTVLVGKANVSVAYSSVSMAGADN
jgi:hypothetical protein